MAGGSGGDGGKVLNIHTEDLKAAAPVFRQQSQKLSKSLSTLISKLDEVGKPWGEDEAGEKFGSKYRPNQRELERAAGVLVLGLVSVYEAIDDMADGHIENEKVIEGMFRPKDSGAAGDGGGSGSGGGK